MGDTKELEAMLDLELPSTIDGTLHSDMDTRNYFSRDVGGMIRHVPAAVLRPGSAEAVAQAVGYCAAHGIKISARGEGHTVFGQSLLEDGLLIDNRSMGQILSIDEDSATVGPGVLWTELLHATAARGFTPTLTGFTDLSVGGTLSVGGVSGSLTNLQIDQVRELQVVTGNGEIVECSESTNTELFEVVLGGLGRFGIITRARVALTPAPLTVRTFRLDYLEGSRFFRDLRLLLGQPRFDSIYASWRFEHSRLVYEINLAKKFLPSETGETADAVALPEGIDGIPSMFNTSDYVTWATETARLVSEMQRKGSWNALAKPWLDVWLPDTAVAEFLGELLGQLTPEDIGDAGFILLIPQQRSKITNKFFRIPEPDGSDWIFLFDLLTVSPTPCATGDFCERMLKRNDRLLRRAHQLGGTLYPIGACDTKWFSGQVRYGPAFPELERRKRIFDPHCVFRPL